MDLVPGLTNPQAPLAGGHLADTSATAAMKLLVFNIHVLKLLSLVLLCTKLLSSTSEAKVLALAISILTPTEPNVR